LTSVPARWPRCSSSSDVPDQGDFRRDVEGPATERPSSSRARYRAYVPAYQSRAQSSPVRSRRKMSRAGPLDPGLTSVVIPVEPDQLGTSVEFRNAGAPAPKEVLANSRRRQRQRERLRRVAHQRRLYRPVPAACFRRPPPGEVSAVEAASCPGTGTKRAPGIRGDPRGPTYGVVLFARHRSEPDTGGGAAHRLRPCVRALRDAIPCRHDRARI
jgi:hypothetical protein